MLQCGAPLWVPLIKALNLYTVFSLVSDMTVSEGIAERYGPKRVEAISRQVVTTLKKSSTDRTYGTYNGFAQLNLTKSTARARLG